MITTIMNTRIKTSISLFDALNEFRFRQGRGTGTATLEDKLAQQLEIICHVLLFQLLLDVNKAYDSLAQMRCM